MYIVMDFHVEETPSCDDSIILDVISLSTIYFFKSSLSN